MKNIYFFDWMTDKDKEFMREVLNYIEDLDSGFVIGLDNKDPNDVKISFDGVEIDSDSFIKNTTCLFSVCKSPIKPNPTIQMSFAPSFNNKKFAGKAILTEYCEENNDKIKMIFEAIDFIGMKELVLNNISMKYLKKLESK